MNDQEKKEREDLACRGIDYDLRWCLRENPQGVFDINDIGKVLAVWEGANDEEEWVWILALKDPIFKEHEPSEKHVTPGNVTAEDLLDPLQALGEGGHGQVDEAEETRSVGPIDEHPGLSGKGRQPIL